MVQRYLHHLSIFTLLAATVIAACIAQPTAHRVDEHDWSIDAQAIVTEQVEAITTGHDCTGADQPRLVDRVLVRNARMADGDTAVVRVVTFDQAYAAAKAGRVVVLGYCA